MEDLIFKENHKFGIELPKSVEQTYALDTKKDNTLWADEISKEMENTRMAFEFLPDGQSVSVGSQFVWCLIVFNIKMVNLKWKAKLVVGAYMTKAPATIRYISIMSIETARIAQMISALNDLEV